MSYRFLEKVSIADVAFEAEAKTLTGLFGEAARAVLAIQIQNPEALKIKQTALIKVSHKTPNLLLYRFLQEIIFLKHKRRWLLVPHHVTISESPDGYDLEGYMEGELIDPSRHDQKADVKAVTLPMLEVSQTSEGWKATVVVEV